MEAFEIEPSYDREDPFGRGPRILWGRVAVLAGLVIFCFLIGRISVGKSSDSSQVTRLQNQVTADNTKIQSLQATVAELSAQPPPSAVTQPTTTSTNAPVGQPPPSPTPQPSPSPTAASPAGGTYTVQVGDTLSTIESKFYHQIGLPYTTLIEQANGLQSTTIRPGMKLTIPPASEVNTVTVPSPTAPVITPTTPAATSPRPSPSSTKH
ncbi:MAG TPA: LysM peptidoglycan-binding domain-containing protein [Actinomycetota bacterium]|nr:LysM peptidoglycan-binding domain-containing protein [Actinomycetota bacterium]